jgi:hypothetical protein
MELADKGSLCALSYQIGQAAYACPVERHADLEMERATATTTSTCCVTS